MGHHLYVLVRIYNQALAAEALNLDQLSGMGPHKALEFLIKDFIVNQSSDNEEGIRVMPLGRCVSKYVTDPNVTGMCTASRVARQR